MNQTNLLVSNSLECSNENSSPRVWNFNHLQILGGDDFVDTENRTIFWVPPSNLDFYPRSLAIYGEDEERPDLEASISKHGISTPLIVSYRTGGYEVVSGKCRLKIALKLGLAKIPIEIREFPTPEAELECLLVENIEREKTIAQKIAEAELLEEIEAFKSRERRRLGAAITNEKLGRVSPSLSETLPVNLPEASKGDTRDIVARRVGLSGKTYSNGKKVRTFIADLRSSGRFREAQALLELLNDSVDGAYKMFKHKHRDAILKKIGDGEAKDIKSAIALLNTKSRTPHLVLSLGMVVKPPRRHTDLAHSGRIDSVKDAVVDVWVRNLKTMDMEKYTYKHREIPLPPEDEQEPCVRSRIEKLLNAGGLEPFEVDILNLLLRPVFLNPTELRYLEIIEHERLNRLSATSEPSPRIDSDQSAWA